MKKYDPAKIEKKWQQKWDDDQLYVTKDEVAGKDNFYKLIEWPYPSGNLHMGHWYAFSVPDTFARYRRMQGDNVFFPIGYDAFGLPAENAAIKNNVSPKDWTEKNIDYMTQQMKSMGTMFDWSRAFSSADPDIYRWTQWIFTQFFKNDLAYKEKTLVNWCPSCKTVLANEQVVDGHCERCGTEVEQRERAQWMYRITKYADALIDDLQKIDWPHATKTAQANWIGRSEGINITYDVVDSDEKITCFTTTPVNFAATFIILAPEHAAVANITTNEQQQAVQAYIDASSKKNEIDRIAEGKTKTGVFTGSYAHNHVTGEKIPIWVSDFVLSHVGTGAVQGCPGHDQRDFEFAQKFNLPIKRVVVGPDGDTSVPKTAMQVIAKGDHGTMINSDFLDGLPFAEAMEKTKDYFEQKGWGKRVKTYRLRDWILSRQRYWGTPIPMISCDDCGYVPVPDEQLPVELPELDNFLPADDGSSPLARVTDWVNTACPTCGKDAKRETDTMDTFVDSSWHYLRYTDPNNREKIFDTDKLMKWSPVDLYTGGAEHTTMHLLYSRFFTKALHDIGVISYDEPFTKRRNHGMVLGPDGNKMSKSKGNVIDPDQEVQQYGADTVRMYLAFLGPYETFTGPWNPRSIVGVERFVQRVWKLAHELGDSLSDQLNSMLHKTIKKVGDDIKDLHFNTAISAMMSLLNVMEKQKPDQQQFETFLKLLAPFAPHITEEIWKEQLGHNDSIHLQSWPEYDEALLIDDMVKIVVQINGKVRATLELPIDSDESVVTDMAKQDEKVQKHLTSDPKKVIFVKNKLINFVV